MKVNIIKSTLTLSILGVALCTYAAIMNDTGRAGATGSPGEETCAKCHGVANSGSGSVNIISNIPDEGYTLGATYQISIAVAQSGFSLFGLGFEALNDQNQNAGTLMITNPAETRLTTFNSRVNVVHQENGGKVSGSLGNKVFSFDWKAPATDIGKVTFYTASVAANVDRKFDGDLVYTKSIVIKPADPSSINEKENIFKPVISLFPNPTQKSFSVKYQTQNAGKVTIELNDTNGKLLEVLLDEFAATGSHVNNFEVSNKYGAGLYFVKVKTGSQVSGQILVIE